jgi:hypothetical protein
MPAMCTPAIALASQAAGAVGQTIGAVYAAKGQKAMLRAQADAADTQARGAILSGQRQEQQVRLATANLKSRQRAGMAASGVDLTDGTSQSVLNTTDVMGEIDANTVRSNALAQAFGHQSQAIHARANASALSPALAGVSAGLTGATQVASSWYSWKKTGGLGAPVDNIGPQATTPWAY